MIQYNLIKSSANVTIIAPSSLLSLPNDSLIVVINGLLPSDFYNNVTSNYTLLQYLLNKHDSILYAGQSLTNMLLPDSIVTPAPPLPYTLSSYPYTPNAGNLSLRKNDAFYFDNSTFRFTYGNIYDGYLTYINTLNGTSQHFQIRQARGTTQRRLGMILQNQLGNYSGCPNMPMVQER